MIDTNKINKIEDLISSKIISTAPEKEFLNKVVETYKHDPECKTIQEVLDKHSQDDKIEDILINTDTKDDGGIIAMSGFYYQLLLTVHYIIQMLEGKWDKVVIDHHQDIIVYNNDIVRIIQVKTKNGICSKITDTKAHTAWIPKLLATQKVFNDHSLDIKLEFELISNCTFTRGEKVCTDFENFYKNENFDNEINDKNKSLYQKISECSSKYDLTDSEIRRGLKSFRVMTKSPEDLKNALYTGIAKQFNDFSRANDKIINMIISFLFEKCFNPVNASIQIVDNEDLKQLKADISVEFQKNGEKDLQENSMINILGDFVETIKESYKNSCFSESFNVIIDDLEKEILFFIKNSKNEDLQTVLSRYLKRSRYSSHFRLNNAISREKEFNRILNILLLIKIYSNSKVEFDINHDKLLVINCENKEKKKYTALNLFGVEEKDDLCLDDVVKKFQETFKEFDVEEQLLLINNHDFKVVIAGAYDNYDNDTDEFIEVECKEKPQVKFEISDDIINEADASIALVKHKLYFVDGEDDKVKKIHKRKRKYVDIDSIKENIKQEFRL